MAIGDIVDASGNVVTPAQQPAGGAGGGDDPGATSAFVTGMTEAVPFSKKIGAALDTGASYLPTGLTGMDDQSGLSMSQRYAQNRARIEQTSKRAHENHPWATTAGSIAPMLMAPELGVAGWAGYGAATGLSEGLDEDDPSVGSVAVKTALGGAGGAAGAKLAQALPVAGDAARQKILDAAGRLGVSMPRYSVSTSPLVRRAGLVGQSFPGSSAPLEHATEQSISGMGEAAEATAAGATKETSGGSMGTSLKQWIGPVSQGDVDAKYNAVTQALTNPGAKTPLSATQSVASRIIGQRGNLQDPSGALDQVARALKVGEGTYGEIKSLRTSIGEMIDSGVLPAGVQGSELKQLYGGLSSDLERAAYTAGGQNGVAAHQAATQFAKETAARREQLIGLLGGNAANNSNEEVFGALKNAAGKTDSADIALLRQARSVVPPQSWDSLSRGMVSTLGRDPDGNFSTLRFLTDYGKISDAAKDELFAQNSPLRQNLDDLATVSRQWKGLGKYGQTSGSAPHLAHMGMAVEGFRSPLKTLATYMAGGMFGKFLATPAGAGASANFVRAVGSGNLNVARAAAQRVSATAGAQLGAKVNPMGLVAAAFALHGREEGEGQGQGDTGGGNVPQ